jgi:hypothetical protein
MENNLIFEDIYEPIKFQMKNFKGEIFDCQTQFRTMEDNIEMEKLTKIEYDEEGNIKTQDGGINEKTLKMMVRMCGQTEEFWKQFSSEAIINVINKVRELEKEKYKKKADLK